MDSLLQTGLSNALAAVVLAMVAVLVGWFCRRPAVVHSLWLLVLLKLITPPLWPIPMNWLATARPANEATAGTALAQGPQEPGPAAAAEGGVDLEADDEAPPALGAAPAPAVLPSSTEVPPSGGARVPDVPWTRFLLIAWGLGSVTWAALALWRMARFQSLLRYARPAPEWLWAEAAELAARLDLGRCPEVWLLPGRVSPMLWALSGEPRLFLPARLLERLDDEQRYTLLVHELAHLRRRDHWVRRLEFVVTALYWWHPVVWWARREIREAEEQCCDAWVVWALPGTARTYALALVETIDFLSEARAAMPEGASGIGHVQDLRRRITMIMRGATPRALTWGGGLAVLILGIILLPLVPSWAQTGAPDEPADPFRVERKSEDEAQAQLERARAELEALTARLEKLDEEREDKDPEGQERAAELEKARAELKALQAQLERLRAQVAAAEANLRRAEAQAKMQEKLQRDTERGRAADMKRAAEAEARGKADKLRDMIIERVDGKVKDMIKGRIIIEVRDEKGNSRVIELPPGAHVITTDKEKPGAGEKERRPDAPKPPAPPKPPEPPQPPKFGPGGPEGGDRLRDVERKLEKLLKELDELRQEMRKSKRSGREEGSKDKVPTDNADVSRFERNRTTKVPEPMPPADRDVTPESPFEPRR